MTDDSAELVRFRQAWKAEVRNRLAQATNTAVSTQVADTGHSVEERPVQHAISPREPTTGPAYTRAHHSGVSAASSKTLTSAIKTYRLAVQHEQEGDLDTALLHYRQAFKLDANVDKAYHKEELRLAALQGNDSAHEPRKGVADVNVAGLLEGVGQLAIAPAKQDTDSLARLVTTFPDDLRYEPEDVRLDVHLNSLPDEVVVHILQNLSPRSIERFASVCRKARTVSLDSGVWKALVWKTYVPPQILDSSLVSAIAQTFDWNFRRIYIEQPRVRLDGVYIAVCHYIRAGLSENAWVKLSHLVTYHRFLRFLPDGQVLSLLTNEEVDPRTIIPLLKPTLRMQGLLLGKWALHGTEVIITDLENMSGSSTKHTFQMSLNLRSRPLGRWNKLDIVRYSSVRRDNGEIVPFVLKHERPFWFSKVRSYAQ